MRQPRTLALPPPTVAREASPAAAPTVAPTVAREANLAPRPIITATTRDIGYGWALRAVPPALSQARVASLVARVARLVGPSAASLEEGAAPLPRRAGTDPAGVALDGADGAMVADGAVITDGVDTEIGHHLTPGTQAQTLTQVRVASLVAVEALATAAAALIMPGLVDGVVLLSGVPHLTAAAPRTQARVVNQVEEDHPRAESLADRIAAVLVEMTDGLEMGTELTTESEVRSCAETHTEFKCVALQVPC